MTNDRDGREIKLSAFGRDVSIKESEELILTGCGYPTAEGAEAAGSAFRDGFALAMARNLVGADFRSRGPSSTITPLGLRHFASLLRVKGPVAEDKYGLSVHQELAGLGFIKMGDVNPVVTKPVEKLIGSLNEFLTSAPKLTTPERVALEFFNASFFQTSADARFLLLMTAIETLIEPTKRSSEARNHIDALIEATSVNEAMREEERKSIRGSLGFLKEESFRQAGKRMVAERLGDREYEGKAAAKYFLDCYDFRSQLVHGKDPIPTWAEVNQMNGTLERFVSDLLTVPWESASTEERS